MCSPVDKLSCTIQAAETEGITEQLSSLRKKSIERKQQIAGNKAAMEKLQTATENRPANVDTTELDKEIVSGLFLCLFSCSDGTSNFRMSFDRRNEPCKRNRRLWTGNSKQATRKVHKSTTV